MQLLYTLGLAMVLAIACFYMKNWAEFSRDWTIPCILFRNYAATILVSTIPAVFYMVRRSCWHLAALLLWAMALFPAAARFPPVRHGDASAGHDLSHLAESAASWVFFITLALAGTMVLLLGPQIYDIFLRYPGHPITSSAPATAAGLFWPGAGRILYITPVRHRTGQPAEHRPVLRCAGSMVFYHNAVVQVMGSMGLAGLAALRCCWPAGCAWPLRGGEAGLVVGIRSMPECCWCP